MSLPPDIERQVDGLLTVPTFSMDCGQRQAELLSVLKGELAYAANRNTALRRYFAAWPVDYQRAERIADLPYLPVGVFKANPPLALVDSDEVIRTLTSSATTGQTPSRVVLDGATSKRMTRGVTRIVRDFIGPMRRPYLVIDIPQSLGGQSELGARGAAIQGLRSFATECICCLRKDPDGRLVVDEAKVVEFATKWRRSEALVYGFTYVVWQQFVVPLRAKGVHLDMPNVRVLHSGGWKRLQDEAVTPEVFKRGVASVFGCSESQVVDFYGMVENVGVIYPDCTHGNKHVPAFAEVIVRDPLTLEAVKVGCQGLVQVCSVLPSSFPGFLVLTEDIAEIVREDGCPCGRRGTAFRFIKRVPKSEVRGCGNIGTARKGTPEAALDV